MGCIKCHGATDQNGRCYRCDRPRPFAPLPGSAMPQGQACPGCGVIAPDTDEPIYRCQSANCDVMTFRSRTNGAAAGQPNFQTQTDDHARRPLDAVVRRATCFMNTTPKMQMALMLADKIRHELGHSYVGTEHMLMALCRMSFGVARNELAKAGVTEQRIVEALGDKLPFIPGRLDAEAPNEKSSDRP